MNENRQTGSEAGSSHTGTPAGEPRTPPPSGGSAASRSVALVTGASRGIGALAVGELRRQGVLVAAVARNEEALNKLAEQDPGVLPVPLDITARGELAPAVRRIEEQFGPIELLVNNAGYGLRGAIEDVPIEEMEKLFAVNVFAQIALTQVVLPYMRARGRGRVLFVSSVQGRVVIPFSGVYGASKFALEGFADALRNETGPLGVEVVLLEPGPVGTEFATQARTLSDEILTRPESVYHRAYETYLTKKRQINRTAVAPEKVARLIAKIARARRPKARYRIQLYAWLLPVLAVIMPTRLADWLLMRPYRKAMRRPPNGKAGGDEQQEAGSRGGVD